MPLSPIMPFFIAATDYLLIAAIFAIRRRYAFAIA